MSRWDDCHNKRRTELETLIEDACKDDLASMGLIGLDDAHYQLAMEIERLANILCDEGMAAYHEGVNVGAERAEYVYKQKVRQVEQAHTDYCRDEPHRRQEEVMRQIDLFAEYVEDEPKRRQTAARVVQRFRDRMDMQYIHERRIMSMCAGSMTNFSIQEPGE